MQADRKKIKEWLKNNKLTREWLAEKTLSSKSTVDNWLSKAEIPKAKLELIKSIMQNQQQNQAQVKEVEFVLVFKFKSDFFERHSKIAASMGMTMNEYVIWSLDEKSRENKSTKKQIESPNTILKSDRIYGTRPKGDIA